MLHDLPLAHLLGAVAVASAVMQLVLARWRDLGAMTIGVCGLAFAVSEASDVDRARLGVLLSIAALTAGLAWMRAAKHGVGRLAIDGAVLGITVALALTAWWAPAWVAAPAFGVGVFVTVLAQLVALERPGLRPQRPWVRRRVVVEP